MAGLMMSIGRAADLLGVSPATLRAWEREGKITSIRTCGGHRRYRVADLEAVMLEEEKDDLTQVCPACAMPLMEWDVDGDTSYQCVPCDLVLKEGEVR
jgi:excisionase family DNA binding protein